MRTSVTLSDSTMKVKVEGEINTLTTPELTKEVEDLHTVKQLIFDLDEVPYVSSAGLRLFLACQRTMNECGGKMLIVGCNYLLYEIFESVGYDRIMKIEKKEEDEENGFNSEQ